MFVEPLHDLRHQVFEAAGNEEVKQAHAAIGSVLEIMQDSTRNQYEASVRRVDGAINFSGRNSMSPCPE
jgi:hypothetical protein